MPKRSTETEVRPDIAALLHEGLTNAAIARRLRCDRGTVRKARERLGIPPARIPVARPANKSTLTLEEKWRTLTKPVEGGHLVWTGRIANNGACAFKHDGKHYYAVTVAFRIRTGREPDGRVERSCTMPLCVEPTHVDDAATRDRDRAALAAITGRPLTTAPERTGPYLAPRQAQVLAAAADGAPLSKIAERLDMPRPQVSARLSEAYRALDVAWMDRGERRAAAVRKALAHDLLPAVA